MTVGAGSFVEPASSREPASVRDPGGFLIDAGLAEKSFDRAERFLCIIKRIICEQYVSIRSFENRLIRRGG
jgi:hypothetical protein